MNTTFFSPDMRALLHLLHRDDVRYLIIGGAAVIYHGYPRLTGDIDIFYEQSAGNAGRLYRALRSFWSGDVPGVSGSHELLEPGIIVQFGRPPNRIDLISSLGAIGFEDAWGGRVDEVLQGDGETFRIHFMGLAELIRSKEQAGRPKDQADLDYLRGKQPRS
jgi:hypothetical protein